MVDRQLVGRSPLPTVLAGVMISPEDIPPAENDAGLHEAVAVPKNDDLRRANPQRDRLDERLAVRDLQIGPRRKIVQNVVVTDGPGVVFVEQKQCATRAADPGRYPAFV